MSSPALSPSQLRTLTAILHDHADRLSSLTPKLVRYALETRLGLDKDAMRAQKSAIIAAIQAHMQQQIHSSSPHGLRIRVQLHEPLGAVADTPIAHGIDARQLSQFMLLLPAGEVRTISDLTYRLTRQFSLENAAPHGLLLTVDMTPFGAATAATSGHCILPMSEPIELLNNMQLVHCWKKEAATDAAAPATPAHAAASERKRKRASTIPPTSPPPSAATAAASTAASAVASSADSVAPVLSKHQRKKQRQREAAAAAVSTGAAPVPQTVAASPAPALAASSSVPAVPASLKKKQRRGQRKSRGVVDAQQPATQLAVAPAAVTPTVTPSKPRAAAPASARSARSANAMDTSDSSSSSSSSDSDSDVQASAPRSLTKPVAASASSPAASAASAQLSRLPKGHFKFTDDNDASMPASSAAASSTAAASSAAAPSSLVPVASAPLFFVSSKEHMPREKQQRAQRENGGAGMPRQKEKRRGKKHGEAHAAQSQPNVDAAALPALPSKAAVPFDYSVAAAADSSPLPAAAASSDQLDVSEEQREHEQVTLALETFGEHYIAPRTLKRLGGGGNSSWSAALVKERDAHHAAPTAFDSCPPIDLSTVTAAAGDVIAYRCLELSAEWTPVLSDYRSVRITSHDRSSEELHYVPATATSESKEQDTSSLRVRDLSSTRIVEGPSFTACLATWREAQRLDKKKAKWAAKHQHSAVAVVAASTAGATPSPAAAANSKAATPSHSRPRTSTRFSLMSNVVRALQEKERMKQQAQSTAADTPVQQNAAAPAVAANHSTGAAAHAARSPAAASPSPSRSPLPPRAAATSTLAPIQSFIIPPSDYHLPSRTSPRPAAAAAPPAAPTMTAAAATTAASSEPTLSQLEQLIQQKRQELEAKERMQA